MLLRYYLSAVGVFHIEWQAAYLCAFAAVGRAACHVLAYVAASAEAYAECAVDEYFESGAGCLFVDLMDFVQGEFSG